MNIDIVDERYEPVFIMDHWFWTDGYSRRVGPIAAAIYVYINYRESLPNPSFPEYAEMAHDLAITEQVAIRETNRLAKHSLLSKFNRDGVEVYRIESNPSDVK